MRAAVRFVPHFVTAAVRSLEDGAPRAWAQFCVRCTQWGGRHGAVHRLGEGTERRVRPLWGAALRSGGKRTTCPHQEGLEGRNVPC